MRNFTHKKLVSRSSSKEDDLRVQQSLNQINRKLEESIKRA